MNCPTNNNSDKNKAILELQKVRAAISASVVTNLSHLTDADLKKLDKLVTKRRNENGNYTAEEFKKLPQWKKAVTLAYDVIANIKARNFVVAKGTYISAHNFVDELNQGKSIGTQEGKNCLLNAGCHVCAKGAMFVSSALKTNCLNVGEVINADEYHMSQRLVDAEGIFDQKTFDTIECAFEGGVEGTCAEDSWDSHFGGKEITVFEYSDPDDTDSEIVMKLCPAARRAHDKCVAFFKKYPDSRTRLVAIMLNVIRHKGKFKPGYTPANSVIEAALA